MKIMQNMATISCIKVNSFLTYILLVLESLTFLALRVKSLKSSLLQEGMSVFGRHVLCVMSNVVLLYSYVMCHNCGKFVEYRCHIVFG